ncbi:MAG: hypothetical protein KDA68_05890, partial [Planctomycetaceae bacterium]|nr:hypothetical protein [Planctomycetaceae bacterium]
RDINADYDRTGTFVLTGPECLVFFLGGCFMYGPGPDGAPGVVGADDDGNTINDDAIEYFYSGSDDTVLLTPSGFSKNPTNPFLVVAGESTDGPFFEFSPSRLNKSKFAVDFFVYVDSIPSQSNPYVYLSSYEGKRYPTTNSVSGVWLNTDSVGYMQRAYYQSIPDQSEAKSATPHKPKSFQIISPGQDSRYGVGGVYTPGKEFSGLNTNPKEDINNNGLLDPGEDLNSNGELDEPSSDYDNITNLAPGRLAL